MADHPAFPFCSKRCRDVDLGNWFSENYVIPSKAPPPPDPEGADDPEGLDAT
ncbi:MAG: DNA gyrase inhibitor YacG [Planctomycetes bacterium]|nr:DNA gyrase inhibitor YacG [Planctomycetota bacterium]